MDQELAAEIERVLERQGFSPVDTDAANVDVILTDDTAKTLPSPEGPAVVLVGPVQSVWAAIGALRAGAADFVVYPGDELELGDRIERVVRTRAIHRTLENLPRDVEQIDESTLVGRSEPMRTLRSQVERIIASDATVLLTGGSGTGKGHVARLLHEGGQRSAGPFVAINCAAIPEHLLEAELFGYEPGAFTGADAGKQGLFLASDGGVLFLDEIDALTPPLQIKLLRALEERVVRAVGSTREMRFDSRLICATNCELSLALREGRIREDLYFRIKVLKVELPPLAVRGDDILLLAQLFLGRAAAASGRTVDGLTPAAAVALMEHAWPGNVRELQNCIVRAVAQARFSLIGVADLELSAAEVEEEPDPGTTSVPLEVVELAHIARVMRLSGGNVSQAARTLGIARKTLRRKLVDFGLVGLGGRPGEVDRITRTRRAQDPSKR